MKTWRLGENPVGSKFECGGGLLTNDFKPMLREPYFKTEYGKAFLGDSSDLMGELPDESINLVVTSPPFALTRKKAYGNAEDDE